MQDQCVIYQPEKLFLNSKGVTGLECKNNGCRTNMFITGIEYPITWWKCPKCGEIFMKLNGNSFFNPENGSYKEILKVFYLCKKRRRT